MVTVDGMRLVFNDFAYPTEPPTKAELLKTQQFIDITEKTKYMFDFLGVSKKARKYFMERQEKFCTAIGELKDNETNQ